MRVNEIFYSIQGEGRFTGTPAIFIRFSGCNQKCDFCDTPHQSYTELEEDEIIKSIKDYPATHVVITGGEPTLQITASFVNKLHAAHKFVQIETNGSIPLKDNLEHLIDWITCSPKKEPVRIQHIHELKVVYREQDMSQYDHLSPHEDSYYLQPCDMQDKVENEKNIASTIDFIKKNPKWKLSLQTHKILNVR